MRMQGALRTETMAASKSSSEMSVVRGLDVARYMGRWYEIASIPSFFQPRDGRDTRATYRLRPDGATVEVLNETWSRGRRVYIEGTAYKADPASDEAKLKVKFYLPPFLPIIPVVGDYWVLYVDEGYQYALVGEPRRKYLWVRCQFIFSSEWGARVSATRNIDCYTRGLQQSPAPHLDHGACRTKYELVEILCRQTHMDEEVYNQLLEKAKEEGYDVTKLHKTPQDDPPPESEAASSDTKGFWGIKSLFGK